MTESFFDGGVPFRVGDRDSKKVAWLSFAMLVLEDFK
jgi:hypothetical protein